MLPAQGAGRDGGDHLGVCPTVGRVHNVKQAQGVYEVALHGHTPGEMVLAEGRASGGVFNVRNVPCASSVHCAIVPLGDTAEWIHYAGRDGGPGIHAQRQAAPGHGMKLSEETDPQNGRPSTNQT